MVCGTMVDHIEQVSQMKLQKVLEEGHEYVSQMKLQSWYSHLCLYTQLYEHGC